MSTSQHMPQRLPSNLGQVDLVQFPLLACDRKGRGGRRR